MTIPAVYSAGAIFLKTADPAMGSAIGFAGLVSEEINLGQEVRTGLESAGIYETRASITKRAPSIGWGTTQVATALDLIGAAGRCINSDVSHPGLDAYLLAHDRCDARDLSASLRYRIANGLLVPQNLSTDHQGRAQISGRAIAITDSDGNEPIAVAENIAFPSGAADDEEFGLFRQTIGDVTLTGSKRLSIDFGLEVTQEDADGSIYPEWVSVGSVITRITLSGINPKWLGGTYGVDVSGELITHANTTLRFVKYANGQSYEDAASNVHITATVYGLGCITTAVSARERGVSTTDLMIYALHDGSNVPILFDTTAALT
jgi:hypothetical protein